MEPMRPKGMAISSSMTILLSMIMQMFTTKKSGRLIENNCNGVDWTLFGWTNKPMIKINELNVGGCLQNCYLCMYFKL